jgi:N-acetylglucosaminyldiphosphoundecaprenol N-acetyl-beta-D-mannosaminyltransferase
MAEFGMQEVLGYAVTDSKLADVVAWAYAQTNRTNLQIIAVINVNKLWLAQTDEALDVYLREAEVVAPEFSIVWASRVLSGGEIAPIYGVEFAKAALKFAMAYGKRPFLLGGSSALTAPLAARIQAEYPGIELAGMHHGYLDQLANPDDVVKQINASGADLLMVGMGSPRQEHWIWRNRHKVNVPVAIGVGGSFDVIAGMKKDSPGWLRGSGFEWLYRLILDPRSYWRRYLVSNPWFAWQVIKARFAKLIR